MAISAGTPGVAPLELQVIVSPAVGRRVLSDDRESPYRATEYRTSTQAAMVASRCRRRKADG
jgi:hypothetical protein